MDENLSKRWEEFDIKRFAEAVFKGGDREIAEEAKDLMEKTIEARDKNADWGK